MATRNKGDIEIPRIEEFIKTLSEKDLVYLNRLVIERLKLLSQGKSTEHMMRFNLDEYVAFTPPDGRERKGYNRLNKKTASVRTLKGEFRKVEPELLRHVD